MEKLSLLFASLFSLLALLLSCSGKGAQDETDKAAPLIVTVSIPPHRWFVLRVAEGASDLAVNVLAGEGQNAHSYEPTARQIEELSRSAFWLLSGAEFELSLIPKIRAQFSSISIVDGTRGVEFRLLENEDGATETNIDRHSWLGEEPAILLAQNIAEALSQADPQNAALYSNNAELLIGEIRAEFASLRERLKNLEGAAVFVYHPAFGYFLDEFGIRQEAAEVGGKEPSPRALSELMQKAIEEKPAAIFVQAQFPVAAASTLASEIGAAVVPLDPLAENWLENIRSMGSSLLRFSLQQQEEPLR